MATYREAIYMVLDLLKERSDDAYYTEEHVLFNLSKIRASLIEKKYKGARNQAFQPLSQENYQQVCLNLVTGGGELGRCSDLLLKSVETVPSFMSEFPVYVYTVGDLSESMVTYVPEERMPYVGYNKWLKNIIYCSRSSDGHLYFKSGNPGFVYLSKIQVRGIFANPETVEHLSCDANVNCDILDMRFPIEDALLPTCIEYVYQLLSGSRYAPEDKKNDAKDNLGDAGVVRPATASTAKNTDDDETGVR